MENSTKLVVLYNEDGHIVALSRASQGGRDESGIARPRSGVEPGPGQRVAVVELHADWHHRHPSDIIRHCHIVHDGHDVRLKEQGGKD